MIKMTEKPVETKENALEIEKSAEALFKEITRQYTLEMEAHDTLKDKANGIIIAGGTIITLVTLATIQLLNLGVINLNLGLITKINPIILFVVIPYFFLVLSELLAIKSYIIIDLKTINTQELLKKYYRYPKVVIIEQLSSNIAKYTVKNKEKSEDRAKFVNWAMVSLITGIITFGVLLLIVFIVIVSS